MTNTETTATAKAKPEPTACECGRYSVLVNVHEVEGGVLEWDDELTTGCGATSRGQFAPGHDAKLKSFLIKAGAQGYDVTRADGAVNTSADAATFARDYGFGHLVIAGLAKAAERQAVRAARSAAKEQRRAEKAAAKAAKQAEATPEQPATAPEPEPQPETVTARVGRWEYTGQVVDGEFIYADKNGQERRTRKFV